MCRLLITPLCFVRGGEELLKLSETMLQFAIGRARQRVWLDQQPDVGAMFEQPLDRGNCDVGN